MKKYILIGSVIFFAGIHARGQSNGYTTSSLKEVLSMTEAQYQPFGDSLMYFALVQLTIQNDSTRTSEARRLALQNSGALRKAFIQRALTPAQKIQFEQYERDRAAVSPRNRH